MSFQFNRICKFDIGNPNETGLSFGQEFNIEFDITKSVEPSTKMTSIKIYNLSKETRTKIKDIISNNADAQKKGSPQTLANLYVGYSESTGLELIYKANVVSMTNTRLPPDIMTEIICADGATDLANNYVSVGYSAGVSTKQVYADVSNVSGLQLDDTSNVGHVNLAHGFSAVGSVKEVLNTLSKHTQSTWTIEKNKIRVIKKGSFTKDSIVSISSTSGLIGSPSRDDSSGTDSDTSKTKIGWKFTSLLQPKLLPGRRVEIKSEEVNGVFVVDSVSHKGTTKSGDWQSTVTVKASTA